MLKGCKHRVKRQKPRGTDIHTEQGRILLKAPSTTPYLEQAGTNIESVSLKLSRLCLVFLAKTALGDIFVIFVGGR